MLFILFQVNSICNTMRGRVRFDKTWPGVILGGILNFVPEIHRCRRILLIGSGTSYHVALATRYQSQIEMLFFCDPSS